MKRFILLLFSSVIVAIIVLGGVTMWLYHRWETADCTIAEDKHILVIGPSTTACAIDDSLIPNVKNASINGAPFYVLTPLLERILEHNSQIDTVLINHGRFQFYGMTDDMGSDHSLQGMRNKLIQMMSNKDQELWCLQVANINLYAAVLNPDLINAIRTDIWSYGIGAMSEEGEKLQTDSMSIIEHWHKETIKKGGPIHNRQWIYDNCSLSIKYIEQAIEVCRAHNVVPVLFNTPLYNYDQFCTRGALKEYMATLDGTLLIADYEVFQFPDKSYYKDIIHLNKKGQKYFAEDLCTRGLQLQTVKEWLQTHQ